jgi:hypothetical protein
MFLVVMYGKFPVDFSFSEFNIRVKFILDIVHNINSVKKMFRLVVRIHFNKLERIDEIFPRLIN